MGVSHEVVLGESFRRVRPRRVHTLRYSFKPARADFSRAGRLLIEGESVELLVASTTNPESTLSFSGNSEPYKGVECALICDADGRWRIEKLDRNIKNLKLERSEGGGSSAAADLRGGSISQRRATDAEEQYSIPSVRSVDEEGSTNVQDALEANTVEDDVDASDLFGDDDDSQDEVDPRPCSSCSQNTADPRPNSGCSQNELQPRPSSSCSSTGIQLQRFSTSGTANTGNSLIDSPSDSVSDSDA